MKNTNKIALLLSLGALLPVAASAKTLEQSYIDSCNKSAGVPVPVAVVAPHADSWDVGQEVKVEFVVDTAGNTQDISIKSASDSELADAVVDAVKQWKFTPAQRNGTAVAAKVVLPVRVVKADTDSSLALN
jgi:TonB family protein